MTTAPAPFSGSERWLHFLQSETCGRHLSPSFQVSLKILHAAKEREREKEKAYVKRADEGETQRWSQRDEDSGRSGLQKSTPKGCCCCASVLVQTTLYLWQHMECLWACRHANAFPFAHSFINTEKSSRERKSCCAEKEKILFFKSKCVAPCGRIPVNALDLS